MRRRDFLGVAGSAALAWPHGAWAQQPGNVPRIGILVLGNPDPTIFLKEFRDGLRDHGYIEGQNIVIELRSAKGVDAQLAPLAREFAVHRVDIIVGYQTPAVSALKEATREIPIVMGMAGDPVGTGLVASLARPGGNITGIAGGAAELGGKNLELIRETIPSARRVAVLALEPDPFHKPFVENIVTSGKTLGIDVKPLLVKGPQDFDGVFAAMVKDQVEAIVMQPSLPHQRMAEMALSRRLPAVAPNPNFPADGGLMSYSADQPSQFREAATFVDKILKGRKPVDLPVQGPTKFLLVVNLKTANALGLTLPPTLLARADQVIE
jgi:putative ABC transport system substrate-binding protein